MESKPQHRWGLLNLKPSKLKKKLQQSTSNTDIYHTKRGILSRSQTNSVVKDKTAKKQRLTKNGSQDLIAENRNSDSSTSSENEGVRSFDDDRRSKSSTDLRETGQTESPPISRRRRLWNSFKRRTKFRTRSKEKSPKKTLGYESTDAEVVDPLGSPGVAEDRDISELFDAANRREKFADRGRNADGTFSIQNDSLDLYSRSEEKESEVDSGIAVSDNVEVQALRQRHNNLRAHPFFVLDVVLKEGRDLVVRDSCGTSDPYVKFKIGGKQFYKSRTINKNLNPKWDEKFSLPIDDPFKYVQACVFDYDRGLNDDPMGSAFIDISSLELNVPNELKLTLQDTGKKSKEQYMGYLTVQVTLNPKTQDEKEQYFKRMSKTNDQSKKLKTQIWSSVVTIVLIEGKSLLAMDDNGLSDPYVKFRLGNERYKSKYKPKTLNPKWLEQFDLHMFDDQTSHLEISVWDHDTGGRDDIMGRIEMDLSSLEPEVTHTMDLPLEDGAGTIHMLLTISGTSGSETVSDIANFSPNPLEREKTVRKYGVINSFKGIKDIGWLQVKVIKAQGVAAADLGGKSDPFCVLELINSRLQTQTEYKTLNPEWGKVFTFNVKDVHSVLEVSVYDEDRDKKSEFLGKVSVPLLRLKNGEKKWWTLKDKKQLLRTKGAILLETDLIYNHVRNGERRWYQLKDRKLMNRAKGAIQLELDFVFNHFKAAIRTVNPREDKYMQPDAKFKLNVMKRNIDRVTKIAQAGVESGKFLQSCFDWESKIRSIIAFAVYLIIVWNFELYMLPLTLLIVFLKNLLVIQVVGNLMKDKEDDTYVDEDDDDDDDDKEAKEEKKSFKEKLQAIQDVCLQVQEGMDMAASMGERVKNTFNWTVPWLSWLAVILLTIGVVVLYNLPLRILLMAWGINKFTKKLRAPNAIPNNELLDYLSRVPSDKELIMYRELRPDPAIGCTKKKRS